MKFEANHKPTQIRRDFSAGRTFEPAEAQKLVKMLKNLVKIATVTLRILNINFSTMTPDYSLNAYI